MTEKAIGGDVAGVFVKHSATALTIGGLDHRHDLSARAHQFRTMAPFPSMLNFGAIRARFRVWLATGTASPVLLQALRPCSA